MKFFHSSRKHATAIKCENNLLYRIHWKSSFKRKNVQKRFSCFYAVTERTWDEKEKCRHGDGRNATTFFESLNSWEYLTIFLQIQFEITNMPLLLCVSPNDNKNWSRPLAQTPSERNIFFQKP